jgi:hypothetical protein
MMNTTVEAATGQGRVRTQPNCGRRAAFRIEDLVRASTLITVLLLSPASWAAADCDHLCAVERGDQRLGDFLLPLQDDATFEGCVVAMANTPAVNARTLSFTYDEFIKRDATTIGKGGDADFIFYIRLDKQSRTKLRRLARNGGQRLLRDGVLYRRPTFDSTILHVEAVAFGRRADLVPVFPGWREDSTPAHAAVLFDGKPLGAQLTCAHVDATQRCDQPLVNNNSLIGARIRAIGLLVIDCDNYGAARGCPDAGRQLELHPVFTMTRIGTCAK